MMPYLVKMFNSFENQHGTKLVFLENYAQVEFDKVYSFLDDYLKDKKYFVAERLTGANFMMDFALNSIIFQLNQTKNYPNIRLYVDGLTKLYSWKNAVKIENL
jgi:glutathione S-transferase